MFAIGNEVVFQYGDSEEYRVGKIEKVFPNGTLVMRDESRDNNYRSFKVAKVRNATLRRKG
jgi:ferredoxin-fold anticodon binding domain-containing protein